MLRTPSAEAVNGKAPSRRFADAYVTASSGRISVPSGRVRHRSRAPRPHPAPPAQSFDRRFSRSAWPLEDPVSALRLRRVHVPVCHRGLRVV